jgi:hypothetical protein
MDGGLTEPPEGVPLGLEPVGFLDGQRHFDQLRIELGSGAFFDLAKSLFKAPALSISTGTNVMDLRIFFLADKKGKGEK